MKALLIGLGGVGQRHARNLRVLLGDSLELIAYRVRKLPHVITATLQVDNLTTVEQVHGIRAFDDLDAALAQRPQVAFICNPNSLHVPTALKCVEAGCDLFIEKPLSASMEDVDALTRAVETNSRIAMVAYQLRFHPHMLRLRELLASNTVGKLLAVRAVVGEYLPNWHRYEDYRTSYAARADLGGGVVLSQIHELDYLYSLFGLPKQVFALGGHWSSLEMDVEDTASILLHCMYRERTLPVHVQLDYLQSPPVRQCEVVGEKGKITLDLLANTLSVYTGRQAEPQVMRLEGFERNQMFLDEVRHFLKCVETRQTPIVDIHAGAQSLRVALAAKLSMASGSVVELSQSGKEATCTMPST